MMKHLMISTILLVLVAAGTSASDFSEGDRYTSVKVGMIGSGTVDVDGADVDQSAGLSLGLGYDFPVGERLHYGFSVDLHRMKWSADTEEFPGEDSETLLDIGLTWKYMAVLSEDRFAIRPGIGVGYGTLRRRKALNGTNYLTLKANAEVIYFSGGGPGFGAEIGVFYTPTGGDSETDIKIGPLLYARAGVLF
ncbi:MAG: outer membrane beta-barrel protein [bacterium]|nr:outer membrane beta-barrel protein [bacterium]